MTSPTQRSLALLRADGWWATVVEHWDHRLKCRRDLLGFGDILAFRDGDKPMIVQTTSGSNFADRRKKILASEHAPHVLAGNCRIVVHGWRKLKGQPWSPLVSEITLDDFMLGDGGDR